MLSIEKIRALGDVCNTTWGKYSTKQSPTMSFKAELLGGLEPDLAATMKVTFTTVVTFASEHAMSAQMPAFENEAVQLTKQYVSEIKKDYKAETGDSLTLTIDSSYPSVEIINLQPHISPKRTAYYRYVTILKVK